MHAYLWLKTAHLVFVIAWLATVFYLPRILVNLAEAGDDLAVRARLKLEQGDYDGALADIERALALLDKAGPIASASAKLLVRQVRDADDRDSLDRDNAALIARLRVSAEGQEGLGAFLDKRAPHWVTEA